MKYYLLSFQSLLKAQCISILVHLGYINQNTIEREIHKLQKYITAIEAGQSHIKDPENLVSGLCSLFSVGLLSEAHYSIGANRLP